MEKRNNWMLWLSSSDSLFHRMLQNRIDPAAFLAEKQNPSLVGAAYDAYLCEQTFDELIHLRRIYKNIRPLMKDGDKVVVSVFNKYLRTIEVNDIEFRESVFPDAGQSTKKYGGLVATAALRRIYLRASNSFQGRPLVRVMIADGTLAALSPFILLANTLLSLRDPKLCSQR